MEFPSRDSLTAATTACFSGKITENWPYFPFAQKELCGPRQNR